MKTNKHFFTKCRPFLLTMKNISYKRCRGKHSHILRLKDGFGGLATKFAGSNPAEACLPPEGK